MVDDRGRSGCRGLLTVFVVVSHVRLLVSSGETCRLGVLANSLLTEVVRGTVEAGVDGVLVNVVAVVGAETLAVLTLSKVYGAAVGLAVSVNLDASVVVLGVRRTGSMCQ